MFFLGFDFLFNYNDTHKSIFIKLKIILLKSSQIYNNKNQINIVKKLFFFSTKSKRDSIH